ncbi:MAG: exopolyphosphatase, partial [Acidimicrobiales bacterium]
MEQTRLPADAVVAAVDCGTNSTRLLIARGDGAAMDRRMRITRLGEGVDLSGELQPAAIRRTLEVLEEYERAISASGVRRTRAVATSAIRDAANARSFLDPAALAMGAELTVLTGPEEGRLSYRGATSELSPGNGPSLVVDVGGGSTELVTG